MKSFVLTLPKFPGKIENHYFCECGNEFINKNVCAKCGNKKFFNYENVKNYNPELFEIKDNNQGIECFIEYPIFNETISTKKVRLAILINNEIKLNQKFREKFDFYFEEISEIVKMYLKFLNLWQKRKKVFKILKDIESRRILNLINVKDAEVLLWKIYDENISVRDFFEKLLKNSPKSVKKAVFDKYKKQVFDLRYNPLADILILKSVKDVNCQRELINLSYDFFYVDDIEFFIEFLSKFEQDEVVRFLRKSLKENTLSAYINKFNQTYIGKYFNTIEKTILNGSDFVEYKYNFAKKYEFNKFVFMLPQDSAELKEYADKLRNCLSSYVGIHNKRYLIFGIFKEGNLKYVVNYDTQKKFIVEAKGFANSIINEKDYKIIESFFEEFKKVI